MTDWNRNPEGRGGFRAGESGNPGGRARSESALKLAARRHALDVIAELARLVKHAASEAVRVQAGRELLDRGFGRPAQSVDLDINLRRKLSELSVDELRELEAKMAIVASLPAPALGGEESEPELFGDAMCGRAEGEDGG